MTVNQEKYAAFGLVFESELSLPDLMPAHGEADVRIFFGKAPASLDQAIVRTPWYEAAKGQFLLNVDGIARYHVTSGTVITVEPYSSAEEKDILAFLYSSVFAALLQQREYLVLHGAAVVIAGKAVVLAGPSGAGKTAIALALYDRGCGFITDEVCAIRRCHDKMLVYPGLPQLQVWHDALVRGNRTASDYRPVRAGLGKYAVPVAARFSGEASELSHIMLLTNHNRATVEYEPVAGGEKFKLLFRAAHPADGEGALEGKARRFQLYAEIGKTAMLANLAYNRKLPQDGAMADFILKEVR